MQRSSLAMLCLSFSVTLSGCAGGGSINLPSSVNRTTDGVAVATVDESIKGPAENLISLFTPGNGQPDLARNDNATMTSEEAAQQKTLTDEVAAPLPQRFYESTNRVIPENVAGSAGQWLGMNTSATFTAAGSAVVIGAHLTFTVPNGSLLHRHQLANNQCIEFGINYTSSLPDFYAFNWCSAQSPYAINAGLVGYPGGVLNNWKSKGYGSLLALDAANHAIKLVIEEVEEPDGWHLLAENQTNGKYVDMMGGYAVPGVKGHCCGFAAIESFLTPGTSCNAARLSLKQEFYDVDQRALFNKQWVPLNKIPTGGFYFSTKTDCANISGIADRNYQSPYFTGGYVVPTKTVHPGDWWMIQS